MSGEPDIGAIQAKYSELRRQEYQYSQKIAELDNERAEHDLVLSTITKMEADRKCYQLVGGVLVEKTISTVIPDVTFNRDRMTTVVQQLQKNLDNITSQINEMQRKFGAAAGKVSDKGEGEDGAAAARSSKGVLVG